MGVVVLFKPPYQSRGRDHTCTLEIVDEGCETTPLPLIFFNRERGRLPRGVHVGDVVCVRRVELGEFNQRLQGKCQAHSSWLIWDCQQGGGGGGGGGKPTLTSDGASWESQEIERARQLLTWSVSTRTGRCSLSLSHTTVCTYYSSHTTTSISQLIMYIYILCTL